MNFHMLWTNFLLFLRKILIWSESIKNVAESITIVIGGICAIMGILYLRALREKRISATYSFWSQFLAKLRMIYSRLKSEPGIINNFYKHRNWGNSGTPPDEEILTSFKKIAEETLTFLKTTDNQMPAYRGWTTDYAIVFEFLDDVVRYDITDSAHKFKYFESCTVEKRDEERKKVCDALLRLIVKIESAQKKAEKLICDS